MSIDYAALTPEIKVAAAACVVLLLDLSFRGRTRVFAGILALAAMIGGLLDVINLSHAIPRATLGNMFVLDGFALAFKGFFLVVGVVVVLLSLLYMQGTPYEGEYYFLLLSSVLGTMLMASSRDLVMLFISLELVSVPAFVLAGLRKQDPRSNEASLKFFLFGVLSAGLFVYGISLVYGFAGSTNLAAIAATATTGRPQPLLVGGMMLIVAAFGFKISAVPFHFWAPDTYEGSPTPLAAFLSVASKAAGFAGLALLLIVGFAPWSRYWAPLLALISIATMTVGNVLALKQRHLIRLLAYSSIAQAGYMLIPLAVLASRGASANASTTALLVYLLIYAVMNLGAFGVAIGIAKQYPTLLIRDLAGLGRRAPVRAAAMTGFLLSLGGLPPFAGMWAKFYVFMNAVNAGSRTGIVLAVAMVLNSVISLYYYVGVVRSMYLTAPEHDEVVRSPAITGLVVAACLAGVVLIGIYPGPLLRIAESARIVLPSR